MNRYLLTIFAVCLVGIFSATQSANAATMEKILNCHVTHGTCVIKSNGGGIVQEFEQAVAESKERHIHIVISGFCGSACATIIAPSSNACVARSARFVYHSTRTILKKNYIAGLPFWTGDEVTMTAREAIYAHDLTACH